MRHLCRLCNTMKDEKVMVHQVTEYTSTGKPIKSSRIWYCRECMEKEGKS